MTDRAARRLSWTLTLLCCLYIAWLVYVLMDTVPTMKGLLHGLGMELPTSTAFLMGLTKSEILVAGAVLLAVLLLKEGFLRNTTVRIAITLVIFIGAAWFCDFATDAAYKPLFEILEKIEG